MADGKATIEGRAADEAPLSAGPADDPALEAWRRLFVAFHTLRRRVEEMLAPYGLALSQFEALARIGLRPGMVQQDLVPQLLVTKGNVGAMLDRLESGKLIERRPDPQDRRANRLFLTRAGKALVTELFDKRRSLVHEMMSPLGKEQQKSLSALLLELVRDEMPNPCSPGQTPHAPEERGPAASSGKDGKSEKAERSERSGHRDVSR